MMKRDIHLTAKDLLETLQFRQGDFGEIGIISGQKHRAEMCLKHLKNPVKNFTFLGYTFWTGDYKGKKITVGNGGFYAPDSAFVTELLCAGGIDTLIRLGSCGGMKEEIAVGDYVVATGSVRGDGATGYYVDDDFLPKVDDQITKVIVDKFKGKGVVHQGKIWSTDAMFKETKEIVNKYIDKGAIAVDMVTSPFIVVSNVYNKKVAAVMAVSDNLITGQIGFADYKFFQAELQMTELAFEVVDSFI
ncbi:MAG: hypothetical protein PHP69_03375 [Candidatus Omnitrophica bacterium]|jgi:uridine phosphorylase|nr:hypothetical protein [Candidatus Omnitrophota bacterium]MDD5080884.1 hypothetical protein [Candidatus Omnitrophota bacterium]